MLSQYKSQKVTKCKNYIRILGVIYVQVRKAETGLLKNVYKKPTHLYLYFNSNHQTQMKTGIITIICRRAKTKVEPKQNKKVNRPRFHQLATSCRQQHNTKGSAINEWHRQIQKLRSTTHNRAICFKKLVTLSHFTSRTKPLSTQHYFGGMKLKYGTGETTNHNNVYTTILVKDQTHST